MLIMFPGFFINSFFPVAIMKQYMCCLNRYTSDWKISSMNNSRVQRKTVVEMLGQDCIHNLSAVGFRSSIEKYSKQFESNVGKFGEVRIHGLFN